MKQRLQTKDISDIPILDYLAKHQGKWSMEWDVKAATFPELNDKLWRSKVSSMIKRGLSGGCGCGCRGDLEITDKGLAVIGAERTATYSGY